MLRHQEDSEERRATTEAGDKPIAMLARTFAAHVDFCRNGPDRAQYFLALAFGPQDSGALAVELFGFGEAIDGQLLEVVRGLSAVGVVSDTWVEDCARACGGLIRMAVMDYLLKGGDLDGNLARRLVGDLLGGFAVPGSIEVKGS